MPKEAEEEEAAGAPLVLRVVEGLWAVVQAVLALPLAPPEARRLRLAAFNGYLGVDFAWLYEQSVRRFALG